MTRAEAPAATYRERKGAGNIMSRQPVSVEGRADAAGLRNELLGRLGLRENASDADVETAHNGLVEFLELAPREVQSWAAARTTDVDEAFALLSGPEADLVLATRTTAMTQDSPIETYQPPAAPAAPGVFAALATNKPQRNKIIGAIGAVLAVAVVFLVFQMGKSDVPPISGKPTGQETTAAASGATPVDAAKVAALMKKVSANPKDIASLQGLGDIYFAATDFKNAAVWEQKILDVDPKNEKALLSLGAAQFNQSNEAEAKKNWLIAAKLYPNSQEVHYDLGFLYMSQTPPDSVNMKLEWAKVVAIDPDSDLAKTVATHINAPTATPSAK